MPFFQHLLCKVNCVNAFRHRLLLVLTMEEKLWNQGSREDGSAGQPTFGILTMNWLALLLSSTNPPPSCFWVEWLKSIMCNVLNTYQYNWYIVDVFRRWRYYVWCAITYLCRRSILNRRACHTSSIEVINSTPLWMHFLAMLTQLWMGYPFIHVCKIILLSHHHLRVVAVVVVIGMVMVLRSRS